MERTLKIIKYTSLAILILFVIYIGWALWFAATFHGESFKDSEKYIVDLSEDSIIGRIKEYKDEHPEYREHEIIIYDNVPFEYGYFSYISDSPTSIREPGARWYTFRFYIEQISTTVGCRIYLRASSPTEILLISATSSDGINKGINDYKKISRKENRMVKKRFEKEFLDKICDGKWRHKRWYE